MVRFAVGAREMRWRRSARGARLGQHRPYREGRTFQSIAEGLDGRPNGAGIGSSWSIAGNQLGFDPLAASNHFKCVRNVVEADAVSDVGVAVE